MSKQWVITITAVIIVVVVSGVAWALQNQNDNQSPSASSGKSEEGRAINELPQWPEQQYSEAEYEGWKKYENVEHGYSFQYPKEWALTDASENSIHHMISIKPQDSEAFTTYFGLSARSADNTSLEQVLIEKRAIPESNEREVSFAQKKAHLFTSNQGRITLVTRHEDEIFTITVDNVDTPNIQRVLASFEFLESDNETLTKMGTDENGWNVYRSDEYGFEISFPPQFQLTGLRNTTAVYRKNQDYPYLEKGDLSVEIDFYAISKNTDIETWFNKTIKSHEQNNEKLGETQENVNVTTINNNRTLEHITKYNNPIEGAPGEFRTIYMKEADTVYAFQALIPYSNGDVIETFHKILWTVSFSQK